MVSSATELTGPTPTAVRLRLLLATALLFVGGLALTRLLFEWRFPEWLWLGRPLPALLLAALLAGGLAYAGRAQWRLPGGVVVLLPLALNLLYLPQPTVDLAFGRVVFWGSLWLALVLWAGRRLPDTADGRWRWVGPLLIGLALAPAYLLTKSHAVGAADTFEFQVVAPQLGIAHPTGYPLYLLLAKLASLVPVGTVAWRVNMASAVFAVLAAVVIYGSARRLVEQPLAALAGAVAWGLAPVVWSQAIVAEVYTLHALVVAVALWLLLALVVPGASGAGGGRPARWLGVATAFVIGLGLTNHLTSVFLIPAAVLAGVFAWRDQRQATAERVRIDWRYLLLLGAALALPLLLYAYLPLRWQAVNGEPMGAARFVDWVAGGRFQGALQWMAWLRDPTRYQIVGRLVVDAWGWYLLAWAAVGVVYLWLRQRRGLLLLLLTAAGYTFYALNYYVPDLAVFLIPVHVVIGLFVAAAVAAVAEVVTRVGRGRWSQVLAGGSVAIGLSFLLVAAPLVVRTAASWDTRDQSAADGGEPWARGVLARPLAVGAAVLADSEKIAPLYYLQQNQGLRPDLDIMVLPDEGAYRAELDQRTAAGQTVYLARYLPGLAGSYYLNSLGPLLEASRAPQTALPEGVSKRDLRVGPARLVGLAAESTATSGGPTAGVTLYWSIDRPLDSGEQVPVLYARWAGEAKPFVNGQHAAGNSYPFNAWHTGEVIADYHALPVPPGACPTAELPCELELELAWGPPFAQPDALEWVPVGKLPVAPPTAVGGGRDVRVQLGSSFFSRANFPEQARPQVPVTVLLDGWGTAPTLSLHEAAPQADWQRPNERPPTTPPQAPSRLFAVEVPGAAEAGQLVLWAEAAEGTAVCGWLAPVSTGCALGNVTAEGVALPDGATNFADKVALLNVELPQTELAAGGQLPLTLTWRGLAPLSEDYTVFVQVLDAQDRLVGQVDAWPVQGTFPTSQWTPGADVRDPYVLQLSDDLPPGDYRLNVGLYLLATLQRLPVLDESGNTIADKVEVGGLRVAP